MFFSPRPFPFDLRFLFLGLALILGCGNCRAQTPEDAVRALARRVGELRELPQPLAVDWSNSSSLPEAESIILRETFLQEFASHHPATRPDAVSAVLRVSVRETPTNFLVLAAVPTAIGVQFRFAELPRTAFLPVMTSGNGLRLAKQLLWQQAETILDAAEFVDVPAGDGHAEGRIEGHVAANILLLKPDALAIYREMDERLSEVQELPFSGYKYVSRSLRGAIHKGQEGAITVDLPGLHCAVHGPATTAEKWSMQCAATASTTGDAAAGAKSSAATLATDAQVAAISSSCDASSWRLLGEATDWTQADRLLLVSGEMKREEAVASVDFSGPVRRVASAEDEKSALAVVFDLTSGSYEVYRIVVGCGR